MVRSQAVVGVCNLCAFSVIIITTTSLVGIAKAQNQATNAATDPTEATAINSIFQTWGITAISVQQQGWNISGELCSGVALGESRVIGDINPGIKCDCSFQNSTVCHITALAVVELGAVGDIPDDLWTLTYLTTLMMDRNYLTGKLSAGIGNLTRMRQLTFQGNSLSGELPKELGLLAGLTKLIFGSNKFSGSLPSELGNCTNLQMITFDSCGVSGEIPSTFANWQNIEIFRGSDNELTGTIPAFIGNWSKLSNLWFAGNSFTGPIPSELASLTSLTELRISDLSNGSSSLDFIRNMKSLKFLVLRNDNITSAIPSNIGEYQNLMQLDLSFNNIMGQIPKSLFNLSSLSHLFLGNNNLSGTLPSQKSSLLRNIDVSYNNLVGSLPSWINQINLQFNVVANNLTIDPSSSSFLPSGLNCLQRNFPCHQGSPRYSQFAINCGGPPLTSYAGIGYEGDNITLGPATYYVTSTNKWGVSNVGYFTQNNNPQYTWSSSSQFTTIGDSELFQSGRISASSLRYYGLGLQNGNYTVILQFAENAIENGKTWKSLGRRIFDVFVQGNCVLKNFDIQSVAGGNSMQAVQRKFTATVRENYLEIHLFWAGKGTCCIPSAGTYGPSISAISATPDFIPNVSNNPPSKKNDRISMIVRIVVGVGIASFLLTLLAFFVIRRQKRKSTSANEELLGIDAKPYTFSYVELKTATEDFNLANKLGEGGFGSVYKGKLTDGRVIAVKQLSVVSHHGKSQFVTEIATISAVQHRNLVKLYGFCIEGDNRLLVYEYLENKSLDQALFREKCLKLDWAKRFDICLRVAKGLAYLHEESRVRIVHRDLKASNILLDSNLIPKISDFGLAKLYDDKKTHISTRVAGTIGYLAPEYAMRGHLTEKVDVFGFGVVALEIVSGRSNSDMTLEEEKIYLLEWAWHLHENNHEVELVDSNLSEFSEEEVKRVIGVALLCTQTSPSLRPPMSRVIAMLSGDIEVSDVTSRPTYLTGWTFDDPSVFMSDNAIEGTNTTHANSSTSASRVSMTQHSPRCSMKPMLHDVIEEGI